MQRGHDSTQAARRHRCLLCGRWLKFCRACLRLLHFLKHNSQSLDQARQQPRQGAIASIHGLLFGFRRLRHGARSEAERAMQRGLPISMSSRRCRGAQWIGQGVPNANFKRRLD
jgi:hypothetical protein